MKIKLFFAMFFILFSGLIYPEEEIKVTHSWYNKNYDGKIGGKKVNLMLLKDGKGKFEIEKIDQVLNLAWKESNNKITIEIDRIGKYNDILAFAKLEGKIKENSINGTFIRVNSDKKERVTLIENYDNSIKFEQYEARYEHYKKDAKGAPAYMTPFSIAYKYLHPVVYKNKTSLERVQKTFFELYFGKDGENSMPGFYKDDNNFREKTLYTYEINNIEKNILNSINKVKKYYSEYPVDISSEISEEDLYSRFQFRNFNFNFRREISVVDNIDNLLSLSDFTEELNIEKEPRFSRAYYQYQIIDMDKGEISGNGEIFTPSAYEKLPELFGEKSKYFNSDIGIDRNGILLNIDFDIKTLPFDKVPKNIFMKGSVLLKNKKLSEKIKKIEDKIKEGIALFNEKDSADAALREIDEFGIYYFIKERLIEEPDFYKSQAFMDYLLLLVNSNFRYQEALDLIEIAKKKEPKTNRYLMSEMVSYSKCFLNTKDKKYKNILKNKYKEYKKTSKKSEENEVVKGILNGKINGYKDLEDFPYFVKQEKEEDENIFYNKSGEVVLNCSIGDMTLFEEPYQIVEAYEDSENGYNEEVSKRLVLYIVDYKGEIIGKIGNRDGTCFAEVSGRFFFIENGKISSKLDIDSLFEGDEGKIVKDGRIGLVSKTNGGIIVKADYDDIKIWKPDYSNSYIVKIKNKWGVVDANSNSITVVPKYDNIEYLSRDKNRLYYIVGNRSKDRKENKKGLIDVNGKTLLEIEYDEIEERKGYIFAKKNGIEEIFSEDNMQKIDKRYEHVESTYHDYFIVMQNGKYGCVSTKDFSEVLPIKYENISSDYGVGYLIVKENEKYGCIGDDDFRIILPIEYDEIRNSNKEILKTTKNGKKENYIFKNGKLSKPYDFDILEHLHVNDYKVEKDNLYGIFDIVQEKLKIPIEYSSIFENSDYKIYAKKDERDFFINYSIFTDWEYEVFDSKMKLEYNRVLSINNRYIVGKNISSNFDKWKYYEYDKINEKVLREINNVEYISFVGEDYLVIKYDDKYGVMDKDLKIVIEPKYDKPFVFKEGIASVYKEKKSFFIDKNGKRLSNKEYSYSNDFSNGCANVSDFQNNNFIVDRNEKIIFNGIKQCRQIRYDDTKRELTFENSERVPNIVMIDNKFGLISKSNQIIVEPKYDDLIVNEEYRFFITKENGKMGIIDINGKIIFEQNYDEIESLKNGYMRVKKNGKVGVVDKEMLWVLKCEYDSIEKDLEYYNHYNIRKGKKWGLIEIKDDGTFVEIAKPQYEYIKILQGFGEYKISCIDGAKRVIFNFSGEIISPERDIPVLFESDKKKGKFGYKNKNDKIIVEPMFDKADLFYDDFALVKDSEGSYLLDMKGKRVVTFGDYKLKQINNEFVKMSSEVDGKIIYKVVNLEGDTILESEERDILFE